MNETDARLRGSEYWENDDDYPVDDWQYEVAEGNTRLGYHEWISNQKESDNK